MLKFKHPQTPIEIDERFQLIEDRGDRLLVEFVCDMRVRPTFVYLTDDMTDAKPSKEFVTKE